MAPPRLTMIGVGNLMEVIWPVIGQAVGGDDVATRVIGVTADAGDIARKEALFGFEIVLDDNLDALRRNRPDLIMFSPPPTVAPGLIESVLQPYYAERRVDGGPLPELYAFPPMPLGAAYLDALGDDVRVVNIIPNNVTTIGGEPIVDEGYYVCTFASPWPEDRVAALQNLFDGQGAFVELEPHQLVPMLGAACAVSSLWHAVPAVADLIDADHNLVGAFLRAQLAPAAAATGLDQPEPPQAEALAAVIQAWRQGVERYYGETDIAPASAATLLGRGFELTLHTAAVEDRAVLVGHTVGAATKGGVLERAIKATGDVLLPDVEALLHTGPTPAAVSKLTDDVTATCHTVRRHGATLAG